MAPPPHWCCVESEEGGEKHYGIVAPFPISDVLGEPKHVQKIESSKRLRKWLNSDFWFLLSKCYPDFFSKIGYRDPKG